MGTRSTPARRLALWSATGALLMVATYLVFVRLAPGQRLDDLAFEGRKATNLQVRRSFTGVMRLATPVALAAVGSVVVFVSARRASWRAAVVTALTLVGSVVVARGLKDGLGRADLLVESYARAENTFPSGHSAAAATLGLLAMTVSGVPRRPLVGAGVLVWVVLHSLAMLGSGWHRPSDVIGGLALGVTLAGAASAVLACGTSDDRPPTAASRADELGSSVGGLIGLLVIVGLALLWIRNPVVNPVHPFGPFLLVALLVVAIAAAVVVVHARLLRGFDLAEAEAQLEHAEGLDAGRPDQR